MTLFFHRRRKNISQGSIGLHNTPKACKSEQDSQQKFTFNKCSAHVLFPNITSIKLQMQRQEKTGHFHVNSKKEWNNVFNGVNHLSAEQPTIYTRHMAMTQVFHRRKKISQGSIGPCNTPNTCKPERESQQKLTFYISSAHVLFPNITSIKRQMQRQERKGHFRVSSKKEWNMF